MCHGRVGLDDHTGLDRPSAGCHGLGYSFDFDKAHTTVTGDEEFSGGRLSTQTGNPNAESGHTHGNKIWGL